MKKFVRLVDTNIWAQGNATQIKLSGRGVFLGAQKSG